MSSIRNKLDDFVNYLNSLMFPFSIIGLTETWLRDDFNANEIHIPGCSSITANRHDKAGGGTCLYINENLDFKVRGDLAEKTSEDTDSIFIEIANKNGKKIIIGVI